MHWLQLSIVLTGIFLAVTQSKKILSVEMIGAKSHVITYIPLLEELARNGHQVTLLSPSKNLTKVDTIKEIFTFDLGNALNLNNMTPFQMIEDNVVLNPVVVLTKYFPEFCAALYDREDVKELMEQDFDLVFLQPLFNECAMGFVHKVLERNNAHLILFTPFGAPSYLVELMGGHHPTSFVSHYLLGFKEEMTFLERMANTGFNFFYNAIRKFYYNPIMENVYKTKLGEDLPSSENVLKRASLLLSNGHFSLGGPRPNLPNVVDVGGIHSRAPKPLVGELGKFVNKSGKDGFILFSMGTALKSSEMSEEKRQMFFNVFSKLKQRVVWKYDGDTKNMQNIPKNIFLINWMPQQDILGHPLIRLFIMHCGLGGTEEAIFHGVPLLGIPILADQPLNAKQSENHGILFKLEWIGLNEEKLMNGIQEVIGNPKYRKNVQTLSKIFRDQVDDNLSRGVWWVEYVLRHNGAPQLRSAALNLNYFQYHSLDVLGAYILLLLLTVYLLNRILKYLFRKLCSKNITKNIQKNSKKMK